METGGRFGALAVVYVSAFTARFDWDLPLYINPNKPWRNWTAFNLYRRVNEVPETLYCACGELNSPSCRCLEPFLQSSRAQTHRAPRRWLLQPPFKAPHPPLDRHAEKRTADASKRRLVHPLVRDDIDEDVPRGEVWNRWVLWRIDNESWEAISRKWIGAEPPSWSRLQTLSVAESARQTGAHFRCASQNSSFSRRLCALCLFDPRLQANSALWIRLGKARTPAPITLPPKYPLRPLWYTAVCVYVCVLRGNWHRPQNGL